MFLNFKLFAIIKITVFPNILFLTVQNMELPLTDYNALRYAQNSRWRRLAKKFNWTGWTWQVD